jgi:hypothetical protein
LRHITNRKPAGRFSAAVATAASWLLDNEGLRLQVQEAPAGLRLLLVVGFVRAEEGACDRLDGDAL